MGDKNLGCSSTTGDRIFCLWLSLAHLSLAGLVKKIKDRRRALGGIHTEKARTIKQPAHQVQISEPALATLLWRLYGPSLSTAFSWGCDTLTWEGAVHLTSWSLSNGVMNYRWASLWSLGEFLLCSSHVDNTEASHLSSRKSEYMSKSHHWLDSVSGPSIMRKEVS